MRTRSLLTAGTLVGCLSVGAPVAWAAGWPVQLAAASRSLAKAGPLPPPPATVTAACTTPLGLTVTLTWSSVARATSYTVYRSTTSATSGFSVLASGVAATSYTTATLLPGTYWFEVESDLNSTWKGSPSTATAPRTIGVASCS